LSRVFADTSALMALLVPSDAAHGRAKRAFTRLRAQGADLVTTSYVLVETYALLGSRFGLEAIRAFREDFGPLLKVVWVGSELHEKGLDLLATSGRKRLSLVDAVSFLTIRDQEVEAVFAYDRHFADGRSSLVE
jgi:predicted nucleic acid-binding protein